MSFNSTSGGVNIQNNVIPLVGPILIGNLLGWLLIGVLTVQLYVYYLSFPRDSWQTKSTVYGLYLLEIAQTVVATNVAWSTLCAGWGNPRVLVHTSWGFAMIPVVNGAIAGWVQLFFALRIWVLGKNPFWKAVTVAISIISVAQGAAAVTASTKYVFINNLNKVSVVVPMVCIHLGGGVIADTLIAVSMVYLLTAAKKSTWSKAANKRVTQLIRITVETGVLSAVAASVDLGLFLCLRNNVHFTFAAALSKLYSNALMMSLNSRAALRLRSSSSFEDGTYLTAPHFTTVQLGTIPVGTHIQLDAPESGSGTAVPDAKSVGLAFAF
ncbi:hypothetical protein BJV78DRAFT_1281075 [Lactifluus subvellereus]|nr:hypothetical protein BJV78DRAFT_1281075 [Lactifluus subvellereus]